MKYTIGLKPEGHDANLSVVDEDGRLLFSMSLERLSRKKRDGGVVIPVLLEAIRFLDIDTGNVGAVVTERASSNFMKNIANFQKMWEEGRLIEYPSSFFEDTIASVRTGPENIFGILQNMLPNATLVQCNHHYSHAAASYFLSPFDEAMVLSWDGRGEYQTTVLYYAKGEELYEILDVQLPHSIGTLYGCFGHWFFGFGGYREGGKTMGLAAYGDPDRYYSIFKDHIVDVADNGNYRIKPNMILGSWNPLPYNTDVLPTLFGMKEPMDPQDPSQDYKDIAAALQKVLEEIGLKFCRYLKDKTGAKNLCIAGGVGLNCTLNGKIIDSGMFDNVFIPPIPDDGGASAGAALAVSHKNRYPIVHPFLGSEYPIVPIDGMEKCEPYKVAAQEIADGKVVGWYQGRMEAGPRALGNRSILADPRNPRSVETLNMKVKHREPWRPFAPSVLEHEASKWFDIKAPAPFMTTTAKVKHEKQLIVPAIVHADETARLQTVNKEFNEKYYKVIEEFEKLTGVPIIINTSFNIKGEPIVCKPEDAIKCFQTTGIDVLIIGDYVMRKKDGC